MIISSAATTSFVSGNETRSAAESGAEEAILRLVRNPDYTGQNGLAVGDLTADITVSGGANKTIIATGSGQGKSKTVEVKVELVNDALTVTSWKEL